MRRVGALWSTPFPRASLTELPQQEIKDEPFLFVGEQALPKFAQPTGVKAGIGAFSSSPLCPIQTPTNRIGGLSIREPFPKWHHADQCEAPGRFCRLASSRRPFSDVFILSEGSKRLSPWQGALPFWRSGMCKTSGLFWYGVEGLGLQTPLVLLLARRSSLSFHPCLPFPNGFPWLSCSDFLLLISPAVSWRMLSQSVFVEMERWRKEHPTATLREREEERDARRDQECERGYELIRRTSVPNENGVSRKRKKCPQCPQDESVLHARGKQERKRLTQGDQEIKLTRHYGSGPQCGSGLFLPGR